MSSRKAEVTLSVPRYSVVVAKDPPYMSSKNMDAGLAGICGGAALSRLGKLDLLCCIYRSDRGNLFGLMDTSL